MESILIIITCLILTSKILATIIGLATYSTLTTKIDSYTIGVMIIVYSIELAISLISVVAIKLCDLKRVFSMLFTIYGAFIVFDTILGAMVHRLPASRYAHFTHTIFYVMIGLLIINIIGCICIIVTYMKGHSL